MDKENFQSSIKHERAELVDLWMDDWIWLILLVGVISGMVLAGIFNSAWFLLGCFFFPIALGLPFSLIVDNIALAKVGGKYLRLEKYPWLKELPGYGADTKIKVRHFNKRILKKRIYHKESNDIAQGAYIEVKYYAISSTGRVVNIWKNHHNITVGQAINKISEQVACIVETSFRSSGIVEMTNQFGLDYSFRSVPRHKIRVYDTSPHRS